MCSGQIMVVFKFVGIILDIIKIAVPILLIIMGSIDFAKAIIAGKDDEIKKSQSTFIKRVIAAVIVFFVPTIVGLLLSLINQDKNACLSCVLNTSTCNITETNSSSNDKNNTTNNNSCSKYTNESDCQKDSSCSWVNMNLHSENSGYICTNK